MRQVVQALPGRQGKRWPLVQARVQELVQARAQVLV